jgi:hypothetical protein
MGQSKRNYEELIEEYNHQMMISNLQVEALLYETLCDKSPKDIE